MKWVLVAVAVVAVIGGLIYASQRDDSLESDAPKTVTWDVITDYLVDLGLDGAFQLDGDPHGVFLASAGDKLYEVDRQGVITWALSVSEPIGGCYWASYNRIGFWVVGNGLYIIDRNGDLMWSHRDWHLACAAPSAWDDVTRAVIGTDEGSVYGTYRGNVEWTSDIVNGSDPGAAGVAWLSTEEGRHVALLRPSSVVVEVYPDGAIGDSWSDLPTNASMVDLLPFGGILVCGPDSVAEFTPEGVLTWEYGGESLVQCCRLPTGSTMLMESPGEVVALAPNEYVMWRAQVVGATCVRWSLDGGAE